MPVMRGICQVSAGVLALAGAVVWLACGANRGWTKTLVPVKVTDEVTGIEGVEYRKHFSPGLDFLGAALLGAGALAGASLLLRRKHERLNHP